MLGRSIRRSAQGLKWEYTALVLPLEATFPSALSESWGMPSVRLIKHEAVPDSGSCEIRFPDGRPSKYIYWDDLPGRRSIRPGKVDAAVALRVAKIFTRAEQRRLDLGLCD